MWVWDYRCPEVPAGAEAEPSSRELWALGTAASCRRMSPCILPSPLPNLKELGRERRRKVIQKCDCFTAFMCLLFPVGAQTGMGRTKAWGCQAVRLARLASQGVGCNLCGLPARPAACLGLKSLPSLLLGEASQSP